MASIQQYMDTPKHGVSSLCSSCQSLLTRPARDPKAQKGTIYKERPENLIVSQLLSEIIHAAVNGCVVCKLVIAMQETMGQRGNFGDDPVFGFRLALCWFDDQRCFTRIELEPFGREESSCLTGDRLAYIDLDLADGICQQSTP